MDILLVEDNPGDVMLLSAAMRERAIPHRLHNVQDGQEALQFLRRQGKFRDAPRPGLIVLDLNLPIMTGRELLAAIQLDPSLKAIPVIIFTSSTTDGDILEAFGLHENAYLIKPPTFEGFVDIARQIDVFCRQASQQA